MMSKRSSGQISALLCLIVTTYPSGAEEKVTQTEITSSILVFGTSTGNVVVSVGSDGALLIGTPAKTSTAAISEVLATKTKSSLRYVVIFPQDGQASEGDAGWTRRGAYVAMHENALRRLGGAAMGPPDPLPAHWAQLGIERPAIAFSEVLAFDLNRDAIHVVHQKPGYSDADAVAHFHAANLVYFGEVFPGDGYPKVASDQGGQLEGILTTLEPWTVGTIGVVPARGSVTDGAALKAFCAMIVAVRNRVETSVKSGKSESQIMAAHPTAEFDSRWGHGRLKPDEFVHEVFISLTRK
jgi:cyclase